MYKIGWEEAGWNARSAAADCVCVYSDGHVRLVHGIHVCACTSSILSAQRHYWKVHVKKCQSNGREYDLFDNDNDDNDVEEDEEDEENEEDEEEIQVRHNTSPHSTSPPTAHNSKTYYTIKR